MEQAEVTTFATEQLFNPPDRRPERGRRGRHSGATPSDGRTFEIQHLWERHHKMLRLTMLGWDQRDIATELGCTIATVNNCVNSALGKRILQEMQAVVDNKTIDVATKLQELSQKAALKLEELLEDPDTPRTLQARIAMDNLDRTGHARQINVKGQFTHGILTADDIERLKQAAYAGDPASQVIEPPTNDDNVIDAEVVAL